MKPYAKAVVGFLVALTGSLATAAVDNSIVLGELLSAVAAAVAAGAAVFGVPNKPDVVLEVRRPPHVPDPGHPPIH